jgi:sporulation protein YlmC with PRC-barrel domain
VTDSFKGAIGRKVVSRASAAQLGTVGRLVIDVGTKMVTLVVVGKGRKAKVVGWDQLSGFGPDAVMVSDDGALHTAADDREKAAANGTDELLGKRVLTELGRELGTVEDVLFDAETGSVEQLVVGEQHYPAATLLGNGSYAAVLDRTTHPE